MMSIQERFEAIQAVIAEREKPYAALPVTIVAVTKYASIEQMQEAYRAGLRHFGENKVQDALAKMAQFPPEEYPDLHWHLIGTLQSNKVKKTVGRFACIHTVDSLKLAEAISEANTAAGLRQAVFMQINLSADASRHGLLPDQATSILPHLLKLKGIDLRGLMTLAPPEASLNADREALQNVFNTLRQWRDTLSESYNIALPDLSMGMTHDFPHALACGATIIRIGNYLFKN